ncbi:hypothetical protein [Methylocystis parvus]|uniref:hypothetical protein n=1 Tax=Methylocystis parvus TaxID=134 RepID=UPI003C738FC4
MSQRIIIAGHSHTAALGFPLSTGNLPTIIPLERDDFEGLTGAWPRDEAYWEELIRVAQNRTVIISWNGNQHISHFLLLSEPEFEFVLPKSINNRYNHLNDRIDKSKKLVPFRMLLENYRPSFSHQIEILKRLLSVEGCKPIIIGTPPPRGDSTLEDAFDAKASWFSEFAQLINVDIGSVNLSSATFRLKCWMALQFAAEEVASAIGARFIPSVPAAQNQEGFLRSEYAHDFTHANGLYGDLMLNFIKEQLQGI